MNSLAPHPQERSFKLAFWGQHKFAPTVYFIILETFILTNSGIFRFDIRPPDSRFPSSQERHNFGSYGFLTNSKTILPYSFTILMSSAPEAMFLKYGQASEDLVNTMVELLNNYFTTNHIQRAVIYDIRTQKNQVLFDCTLGIYFLNIQLTVFK